MTLVLIAVVVVGCGYWLVIAGCVARVIASVPVLERERPRDPARWPSLSVIVPACNEGQDLEAAMRSRLAQDYPDLQLVLIDDRSTDDTGLIVDRLASEDARVLPLHVTELPDGWLGKLHAMHRGVGEARGEWLLMSDADVHFAPGALRRAVAFAEERGLDHLAVFPPVWSTGFALDVCLSAFGRLVLVAGRVWAVADPHSRAAAGVGAFNLVRRSALDKTGGFEWLRLEVADDMALGQMLKRAGARCAVANGRGLLGLYFYRSVAELARGAEKAARMFQFSIARAVLAVTVLLSLELGALLGLLPLGVPWLFPLSVVSLLASVGSSLAIARWIEQPRLAALISPLGSLAMGALLLRGGVLPALRGGLSWRGTAYPARALIEGGRFELG